jgi:hypothetical protein
LKSYLDEQFAAIRCQILKLDSKLDTEHDKILSAGKDSEYITGEVNSIKSAMRECKDQCNRRKDDFNRRVDERIADKVNLSSHKIEIWIHRAVNVLLIGIVTFLLVNFVMTPVKQLIQQPPAKTQRK